MPVKPAIRSVKVQGFRSLADVTVPLGPLTVLVGPNGSGKTNVLNVLRLLGATIRFDLITAIDTFGGYDHILRNDGKSRRIHIEIEAVVTDYAHDNAPDRYTLDVHLTSKGRILRSEEFTFKRVQGRGRRITVNGATVTIGPTGRSSGRKLDLANEQTTGLSTLPRLGPDEGGEGIDAFARFISSIRVFEADVAAAREPSRRYGATLAEDASNLADSLLHLKEEDAQAFADVERDLRLCLPGLDRILLTTLGASTRSVLVQLQERGLKDPIDLADASFGTVRLLALLVALHEPKPPLFTAIEEVDHGLHPYAMDVIVDALRSASERTQLLVATHSPTLVNRLRPEELVICDRDPDTGASIIPALDAAMLARAADLTDLRLGELWFSGAVRGVPA